MSWHLLEFKGRESSSENENEKDIANRGEGRRRKEKEEEEEQRVADRERKLRDGRRKMKWQRKERKETEVRASLRTISMAQMQKKGPASENSRENRRDGARTRQGREKKKEGVGSKRGSRECQEQEKKWEVQRTKERIMVQCLVIRSGTTDPLSAPDPQYHTVRGYCGMCY